MRIKRKGFTLVEMLVVLVLISILVVILSVSISYPVSQSKTTLAQNEINSIALTVNSIAARKQTLLIDAENLARYINDESSINIGLTYSDGAIRSTKSDPWGNKYRISVSSAANTRGVVTIRSIGPDKRANSTDDIVAKVTYDTSAGAGRVIMETADN